MKTKDIPEIPILELLLNNKGRWCFCIGEESRNVASAMPKGIPQKLVISKMRAMIRKGLVKGCPCGCRGDYEITVAGELTLAVHKAPSTVELQWPSANHLQ